MKNHFMRDIYKRGGRFLRMLCATVFILVACVGCITQAPLNDGEDLKNGLTDAVEEIDSVKESYAAAQKEIASLKSDNEAAQKEIALLKDSNEASKKELVSLKSDCEAAQEDMEALKEQKEAVQRELETLKESHDAAREEIASLKSDSEAASEKIESLENKNDSLQQEIEALKAQIQELLENAAPEEPSGKIKIYIDQGHNPTAFHNSGAEGNGLYEEDLTYEIGHLLATLLTEDGRFEVRLSRPTAVTVLGTDNTSSLEARVAGAKEFGADYFISLHINAYGDERANGIEVYAAEENSISYAFGNSLLQGMIASTNLYNRGMKLNPDLHVLKNATMPAVLLEMGFISNVGDSTLLSEHPELFAQGIYDGILACFHLQPQETDEN